MSDYTNTSKNIPTFWDGEKKMFKFGDKVMIYPDDNEATRGFNAYKDDIENGQGALIVGAFPDDSEYEIVVETGSDTGWDFYSVPASWVHEEGYQPKKVLKDVFVLEIKDLKDTWIIDDCFDEGIEDILKAQEALVDHRKRFPVQEFRLTYNGVVLG